ncbi:enhanced intracellular survival protein Eis [Paenibacillus sp. NPDC057967]|uniref:GNAT family N-acetyltransferase n=1 Tax=Paenibacillus sp. NPDC057967 TaxID=3346293 RepID=UPI0036DDE930
MAADEQIVSLTLDRFNESMELSQFAFQYKRTPAELEDIKDNFIHEPGDRWAVLIDGQFAAQAVVLDLQTYIAGRPFRMGGVAGVATWPEYRRQGLVGKLLVHSLQEMRAKGQTLSFLAPFAFGFYRKFGWGTYTDIKTYTLQANQLPPRSSYPGKIRRVSGYDHVQNIYEAYASQFNGSLQRTPSWWERRVAKRKSGQIALYTDAAGNGQGYIIYEVAKKELNIHEFVFLNEEARSALWSFIGQHDSMIERVIVNVPADDILPDLLPNPRIKQEIEPYFMGRIVDVEAFLKLYPFAAGGADTLYLQVTDAHAPWNQDGFTLRIEENGEASISRDPQIFKQEHALHIEIGDLTTLMLGYRSAVQLSSLDRIHGPLDNMNRLHLRIPERTTYLPDFF